MNALSSTAPLQALTQLQELDLSANHISSLEGSDKLTALRKLRLAGNHIQHQDTLLVLSRLTHLKDLSLQLAGSELTNPVCTTAGYSEFMTENFLGLMWLDGEKIRGPGAELYTSSQPTSIQQQASEEGSGLEVAMTTHGRCVFSQSRTFILSVHPQLPCQTTCLSLPSVAMKTRTWSQVSHHKLV